MGKREFVQLQIIDITQLQQKDVGGIRSNENLILVEIDDRTPFGQKFNPVGGLNIDGLSLKWHGNIVYNREQLV